MFRKVVPAALLVVACSASCFADAVPEGSQVAIPVLVTTAHGTPVINLTKENFRLFEDKAERRITGLTVEHAPVSLAILADESASMREDLNAMAHGVASLLSSEVRGDEAFLVEFASAAQVTVPFTEDSEKIIQQTLRAQPVGRTCMFDAIDLALRELQHARNSRRAIVILSDGGDNASRTSESAIHKSLADSDIALFAVAFFRPNDVRLRTPEEAAGPALLQQLAKETGSEFYWPERPEALASAGLVVGKEMHTRYVLSYSSAHALADGKRHRIRIELTLPKGSRKLVASYRETRPEKAR